MDSKQTPNITQKYKDYEAVASKINSFRGWFHSLQSSLVEYLVQVIYVCKKKLSHHFLLHFPIGMGSYDRVCSLSS